jgi:hypothetical protein
MANFAVLLLLPLALSTTTFAAERFLRGSEEASPNLHYYESFKGPDPYDHLASLKRSTWRRFRVRTGDRYLGGQKWEHYLCFEQHPGWPKAIKLSAIHLASTVHKSLWS